jgi:integrase
MAFGRVTTKLVRGESRFLVEWRDAFGKRKSQFFTDRAKADAKQSEVNGMRAITLSPAVYGKTVAGFAAYWLDANRPVWARKTWQAYEVVMRCHVLPFPVPGGRGTLGELAPGDIMRAHIKAFVQQKRADGYEALTVRGMFAALRTMLNEAVEEEIIQANPLGVTGRNLRKFFTPSDDALRAMDQSQAARFLQAAAPSPLYGLFLCGFDQGLRIGELRAWAFDNLNLETGEGTVAHSMSENGRVLGKTKSKRSRVVDLTNRVRTFAGKVVAARPALALSHGWRPVPTWLFVNAKGGVYPQRTVQDEFLRVLKLAGLDGLGFTPHSMRHTFACLHLANARDRNVIQWVQQQLGHTSIKITVDTYGRALRLHDPAAADRLELLFASHGANRQ